MVLAKCAAAAAKDGLAAGWLREPPRRRVLAAHSPRGLRPCRGNKVFYAPHEAKGPAKKREGPEPGNMNIACVTVYLTRTPPPR